MINHLGKKAATQSEVAQCRGKQFSAVLSADKCVFFYFSEKVDVTAKSPTLLPVLLLYLSVSLDMSICFPPPPASQRMTVLSIINLLPSFLLPVVILSPESLTSFLANIFLSSLNIWSYHKTMIILTETKTLLWTYVSCGQPWMHTRISWGLLKRIFLLWAKLRWRVKFFEGCRPSTDIFWNYSAGPNSKLELKNIGQHDLLSKYSSLLPVSLL